ncbi:biotin--[acetyl-CoA-carboxylase] ligase [Candidatus Desantisbacteria bacterium]|nr:biotin--[acetyl-CoA-carboxylase] ligase [Candidatus Desantisbacteria bacterium]
MIKNNRSQGKEYILKMLKKNPGQFVSGQHLGKNLSLSRTSVWKYIKELTGDGYEIERQTKSGYKFLSEPDLIIPYEIEENNDALFIGKKVYYFKFAASTNEIAHELAGNNASSGTIVISEVQNKGKGRQGRLWISNKGGLWFSLILRPDFSPLHASKITIIMAISVINAIKELFGINIAIKWPNDLFFINKKIGGILIEMNAEIDKINYLVIGIGLNINNIIASDIKKTAVNLKSIVNKKIDRNYLLNKILGEIEKNLNIFKKDDFSYFIDEAKKLCMNLGKRLKVTVGSDSITGECLDLDENGNLLLKETSGNIRHIISGDIEFLRDE